MTDILAQQLILLDRLYKASDGIYRALASRFSLTDSAFWTLYAITHSQGPVTQSDLSSEWFVPVQTVHSTVQWLLKRGYVRLESIPGTRNKKQILLTDVGCALAAQTIDRVDEIEKSALLHFTAEERDTYLRLFRKHLAALRAEEQRVLDSIPDPALSQEVQP